MSELDEAKRQVEALRERISRLCAAVGNITASLDLDTVLRGILESARGLTGARHGVIATVDEAGAPAGCSARSRCASSSASSTGRPIT